MCIRDSNLVDLTTISSPAECLNQCITGNNCIHSNPCIPTVPSRPNRSQKSAVRPTVGQRVRLLCQHPADQRRSVSSSTRETQHWQNLLATAASRVSVAEVDCDARCHFAAARHPRVSGSGHRVDPAATSSNKYIAKLNMWRK